MGRDVAVVLWWLEFLGEPEPRREPDAVVVRLARCAGVDQASALWSELEGALEQAAGRLVVADLTWTATVDGHAVAVLIRVAEAAARRHVAFCAVAPLLSPLMYYLERVRPRHTLDVFSSTIGAIESFDDARMAAWADC